MGTAFAAANFAFQFFMLLAWANRSTVTEPPLRMPITREYNVARFWVCLQLLLTMTAEGVFLDVAFGDK